MELITVSDHVDVVQLHEEIVERFCTQHNRRQCPDKGAFSRVYSNGQDSVIKIMRGIDDGYPVWAEICEQFSATNPYLPRVKCLAQYRAGNRLIFAVYQIERLTDSWARTGCRHRRWNNILRGAYRWILRNPWAWGNYRPVHQDLFAALTLAIEVAGESVVFDLHSGNIMFRGSQLVFTDPIC